MSLRSLLGGDDWRTVKAKRDKRNLIRKPPPSPHLRSPKGCCNWCGEPVPKGPAGRVRNWHQGDGNNPDCLGEYKVATDPASQRNSLLYRDGGRCQECGTQCVTLISTGRNGREGQWPGGKGASGPFCYVAEHTIKPWDADHVVPLWSVDRTLPWPELIKFWGIDNLATSCEDCHDRKTAREAQQRAKEIRQREKLGDGEAPKRRPRVSDLPF